jgi:glycerophosphoryl diester phosphodiesterase
MNKISILIPLLLIYSCSAIQESEQLIIAHRGVPYFAPEETAPAFMLARELGADYLEADLQRTSDGVIIALHDDNLKRTTNIIEVFPERADEPVSNFTWEELQQLDAGSWFNEQYPERARASFAGQKIISLANLVKIAEAGEQLTGIYLETKVPQQFPGIESDLKNALAELGWLDKKLDNGQPAVILQSFVPQSLELLRKEFPETPIAYLLWKGAGCLQEFDPDHLAICLDFAQKIDINLVGVSFSGEKTGYFNQLEPWFLDELNSRNMKVHAYTFDTEKDISNYAHLVDGQFTNRTDLSLDHHRRAHPTVEDILTRNGY